ncbi:hypothetical protein IVB02_03775 [Bradyrhizobium sp. 166]|uniref:hypothetical protein n=1 Tax=Bradyrhizobium sp. 166 TaxID=2782638 RepID=UPI001FFAA875|nr:hypothetical protein [Bradyrhizobium sp. 166]MCK1600566.1 hypothetical protein [Bradyrhizobium sp. 166]
MSKDDDKPPLRLVADNSGDVLKPPTDEVEVAFGEMAARVNECLADGSSEGLFASVLTFVEACQEAELNDKEVDALLGTSPNLSTGDPIDDPINTVLRGAVRMMAGITTGNGPGTPRYEKARDELAAGITKINRAAAKKKNNRPR